MPAPTPTRQTPEPQLIWQVHLLRRAPGRLPWLLLILALAVGSTWRLFSAVLPALAALVLLVAATGDYLFPVRYRITEEGVAVDSLTARMHLPWKDARRCRRERGGLLLTPLPYPSRLDAFRGVLLRFAPTGEPGDRASVMAAIATYAAELKVNGGRNGMT
jgi:subtilisin family serine protease